jgi:hypothetical protein
MKFRKSSYIERIIRRKYASSLRDRPMLDFTMQAYLITMMLVVFSVLRYV